MAETSVNPAEIALKPRDERFCVLIIAGMDQTQAYKESHNCQGIASPVITKRAYKLANEFRIKERCRHLLRDKKIQDVITAGQALHQLLADMELAREAGNLTALMAGHRMLLQACGALTSDVNVNVEQSFSDAELAKRLAQGDIKLEAAIASAIGAPDTYQTQ